MPIRAAGGVLWRGGGADQIALVHRPRYDDWSLPKGKLEVGEHRLVGACREVVEETGFVPVVGRRLPRVHYDTADGPKLVDFWSMRATGGAFEPNHEVDALRWVESAEAAELLTYGRDREVLAGFRSRPPATGTVLLVRHARAGRRSDWNGTDALRPLDNAGQRQAATLTTVLSLWAPTRVAAADRTRCVQTVAPLAEALGQPVRTEPELSDEAVLANPGAGLARLSAIAAEGGTSVVCSQGSAIPALLDGLAARDGVRLGRPNSKKGSAWALEFTGAELTGGDYYPHFDG